MEDRCCMNCKYCKTNERDAFCTIVKLRSGIYGKLSYALCHDVIRRFSYDSVHIGICTKYEPKLMRRVAMWLRSKLMRNRIIWTDYETAVDLMYKHHDEMYMDKSTLFKAITTGSARDMEFCLNIIDGHVAAAAAVKIGTKENEYEVLLYTIGSMQKDGSSMYPHSGTDVALEVMRKYKRFCVKVKDERAERYWNVFSIRNNFWVSRIGTTEWNTPIFLISEEKQ